MDRHENRVVEAFRRSSGKFEISQEYSLPRKSLRIDMLYVFWEVDPVLGPWGPVLAKRLVPIEHFSRSPTKRDLYSVVTEWGYCSTEWTDNKAAQRKALADQTLPSPVMSDLPDGALHTDYAPICLIIADRVSKSVYQTIFGMRPTKIPGSWATPSLSNGGILMLDLSALPAIPGMSFLRWLPTPKNAQVARDNIRALLGDEQLPIVTRTKLHEAVMNQTITSTNDERMSAYDTARMDGVADALQNAIVGVLEVRNLTVSTAQRARLSACNDAAVLNKLIQRSFTVESVAVLLGDL